MKTATNTVEDLTRREYKYGFVTDIEADTVPPGLNEEIIRFISAKKNEPEFMLQWRLKAYRHWAKLEKSEAVTKKYTEYKELFTWTILVGLTVLLLEQLLKHTIMRRLP